jgi:hypothetical protein
MKFCGVEVEAPKNEIMPRLLNGLEDLHQKPPSGFLPRGL